MIGSFGDVVFEVSADKISTFDGFARSASSRWQAHEILGQKPRSEFVGPGLDTITFTMRFDVRFGVNPKQEMDKLLIMCREGRAATLIVGGEPIGVDKWVIKSITQRWTHVDGAGRCIVGTADVSLEEYVGW